MGDDKLVEMQPKNYRDGGDGAEYTVPGVAQDARGARNGCVRGVGDEGGAPVIVRR